VRRAKLLTNPHLSTACKRELFTRWAWDEHLLQLASDEAMPEGHESSRLDEVKSALLARNELERGDPPVVAGKTRGAGRRAA
jgi:hypothetical protein